LPFIFVGFLDEKIQLKSAELQQRRHKDNQLEIRAPESTNFINLSQSEEILPSFTQMDDSRKKWLHENNHEMPKLDGNQRSRYPLKPIKQSKMSRNLQMVVNIDTTINGITTSFKLSLTAPLNGMFNLFHS
jgi:hypothetical protein